MTDQAYSMAHLRDLPKCRCGKAATVELRSGVNASIGVYCSTCGKHALRSFKARGNAVS